MLRLIFPMLLIFALTACSTFNNPTAVHRAACKDLKSKIIFNGATSDERRASIQRAEEPLEQATYDANC